VLIFSTSLSAQVTALSNLDRMGGNRTVGTDEVENNVLLAQEFVTGGSAYTNEPITVTLTVVSTGSAATF
jgi:hypothetical protein